MKKRILSIILTACLVVGLMPTAAFASENVAGILCEHHPEHTTECGYEAAIEGHACTHEHDESCGYAEEQACTHEHDEECGYVEASEESPCTFTCDICEDEEELQENNLSQAVLAVQDLIDTIPEAEDITEDNYEDIADLLGEIDTLKEELTEEESVLLDFTKYDDAVAKMMELMGQAVAEKPALMTTEETCTCLINCKEKNNGCTACTSGTTNCKGRTLYIYPNSDGESLVGSNQFQSAMMYPPDFYFELSNNIIVANPDGIEVPTVLPITVPSGADVLIDLNGKILNVNQMGTLFEVSGKLTIIDTAGTGKIINASNGAFHILENGSVLMLGGTIENCTGKGAVIVESDGTFEMAGGTIKGDIHNEGKILYRNANYGLGTNIYGTVKNFGTIDAHKGNSNSNHGAKFYSTVENNGTIISGHFHSTVENKGTISGGVFHDNITIKNNGTISGGDFQSTILNNETGIISGGKFIDNFRGNRTIHNSGTISGGEFSLPVVNNATISGGTFNSQVKNDGVITDYIGEISGGTFYGYVENRGVISGGIFYGTVDNSNGTIQDSAYVPVYFVTNKNKVIDTVKVLRGQGVPSSDIPQFRPQQYGYDEFAGWSYGGDKFTGGGQFTEDENYIYAELSKLITYDISYNLYGGTATNPATYNAETETFTLENPTKTGYDFAGWSETNLDGSNNMTVTIEQGSTGNRVFTANYTVKNNFTVNFNTNGGSSIPSKQNVKWTDRVLDNVKTPSKSKSRFNGWICNGNTVNEYTTYSQLVSNDTTSSITLLAKWSSTSGGSSGGGLVRKDLSKPSTTPTETSTVGTVNNTNTSVKTEATTNETNKAAVDTAKNDATVNLVTTTGTKVSSDSFKEPVILSIPADTNGVENVNNLTLARFNTETGKLEIIGGTYNAETNTVSGYIDKAGDYFVVEKQGLLSMTLQVGNTDVTLNTGNKKLDVAPIISQDRTLVPLRFISESLGANVSWENTTKNVTVELDGKKLNMQIGKEIEGFGAAPIISNNRTLVPIRYISEELGANVLWIPSTQTISIAGSNTNRMFLD